MTSSSKPLYKYGNAVTTPQGVVFPSNYEDYFPTSSQPMYNISNTSIPTPSSYESLRDNIKALEFRISALENSYFTKLKEHEETVEMLLKVIKDAT